MKKLVVIVLHGIGTYSEDARVEETRFDHRLKTGLASRLRRRMDELLWVHILWSDARLELRQAQLLDERQPPRLWRSLFGFVAANLCDATAYALPKSLEGYHSCSYFIVQDHVRTALEQAQAALGGAEAAARTPVLAIAHSMGCHVLSSYAWDARHAPQRILRPGEGVDETGLTDFQRLRTLSGLVFTGCNLPLLTMDIARDALMPIELARRPALLGGGFESRWLNFFEGSDALGYPIARQYEAYFGGTHRHRHRFAEWGRDPARETAPRDMAVTRRTLTGLTPYAHQLYDQMGSVLDPVAAEIARLLDAPRP